MMDNEEHTTAARRLSAALGEKVEPTDIELVTAKWMVALKDGRVFALHAANTAYATGGRYYRNGKKWEPSDNDVIRTL